MVLKRRTSQNIVWGGAAGCMPVLIGWSAVTGSLAWTPVVLFGVIFFWTPPHYWPLSMRFRDDYAAAGVPMLPVVRGIAETSRQIGLYTILLVALTIVFGIVARMGVLYLAAALILGATFLWRAYILWRQGSAPEASTGVAIRLYRYSITYLAVLFAAVALDTMVAF
jgi:protoheme IX farnesyltransferase